MHADAKLELFVWSMADDEALDFVEQSEGHLSDLRRMIVASLRQTRYHHVRVADCLHFVHFEIFDHAIECQVQIIEQRYNL